MKYYLLVTVFCGLCTLSSAKDTFEFKDHGYRLSSRTGDVYESKGFEVKGEGKKGVKAATEKARIESARQDNRHNLAINAIGEAGHGVSPEPVPVVPVAAPPVVVVVPAVVLPPPPRCYGPYCFPSRARLIVPPHPWP